MAGIDKAIPACLLCTEQMTGVIYSCKNGHAACGTCKPGLRTCASTGRKTLMEQTVRAIVQKD